MKKLFILIFCLLLVSCITSNNRKFKEHFKRHIYERYKELHK
jgi:hypothetical protein